MGEIRVNPERLDAMGSEVGATGRAVSASQSQVRPSVSGAVEAAPPETAGALETFAALWSAGIGRLGEGVGSVGALTQLAAALYALVDEQAMPAGGERGSTP